MKNLVLILNLYPFFIEFSFLQCTVFDFPTSGEMKLFALCIAIQK